MADNQIILFERVPVWIFNQRATLRDYWQQKRFLIAVISIINDIEITQSNI